MLTAREKEVLELIVKGHCNKDIAEILNISTHTVKAHKENIYYKMNVHNSVQAAIKYYKLKQEYN